VACGRYVLPTSSFAGCLSSTKSIVRRSSLTRNGLTTKWSAPSSSAQHLHATHPRHHDVQQDQVWSQYVHLMQGFLAVGGRGALEVLRGEEVGEKRPDVDFVVDDQHELGVRLHVTPPGSRTVFAE
jgi:hypothetical protein